MKNFNRQITVTEVGHSDGYNHKITVNQVDIATYGVDDLHVQVRERFESIMRPMLESPGTGWGCYVSTVQSIEFQGLVGQVEQPNPYSNDNKQIYGVYRWIVTVRTTGSD